MILMAKSVDALFAIGFILLFSSAKIFSLLRVYFPGVQYKLIVTAESPTAQTVGNSVFFVFLILLCPNQRKPLNIVAFCCTAG